MNPGGMKCLITVYSRGTAQEESGYMNTHRAPVCAVRARRTDAGTREIWEAYAAKARNVVNFEIRPRTDIRVGMWIECEGKTFEIIALQRVGGVPGSMIVKTKLEEAI